MRTQRYWRRLAAVVAMGVATVTTGCGSEARVDVAAGGAANDMSSRAADPISACSGSEYALGDGTPVDWTKVAARFDSDGPFRLPVKPKWLPAEGYCGAILSAISAPPAPPDGATAVDPGVNRFVLAASAKSMDDVRYTNAVLTAMYPASILPVYDGKGNLDGFITPGLGQVGLDTFATAADAAASPEVKKATSDLVAGCSSKSCDSMIEAAIESGNESILGSPVQP